MKWSTVMFILAGTNVGLGVMNLIGGHAVIAAANVLCAAYMVFAGDRCLKRESTKP